VYFNKNYNVNDVSTTRGTVGAEIKCVANWVASVMGGVCNGPWNPFGYIDSQVLNAALCFLTVGVNQQCNWVVLIFKAL